MRSERMKPAVVWGVVFLRKCISILPGITLSEKRAARASRFVSTERGPCLLSIQLIRTLTTSTLGLSLIKRSSKCCRVLAEGHWQSLLSWLSAGVHTPLFLGWARTNQKKKNVLRCSWSFPPTLSHRESTVQVVLLLPQPWLVMPKPAWLLQGLVSTVWWRDSRVWLTHSSCNKPRHHPEQTFVLLCPATSLHTLK